jgi:hypothetical protein
MGPYLLPNRRNAQRYRECLESVLSALLGVLPLAVRKFDARIVMCVPVIPCGALPSGLKWTQAASNSSCNYEAPVVCSFDNLRHLMVTYILKVSRHRSSVLRYFPVIFKKDPHHVELVHEFRFFLYICHIIGLLFEPVRVTYVCIFFILTPW